MATDRDRQEYRNRRDFDQEAQKTKVDVVDVERHGESIIIPDSLDLERAIRVLELKKEQEEQVISFTENVHAYPWDGALALKFVLEHEYGVAVQQSGWFGARMIAVETGHSQTTAVPWGDFQVPGLEEGTIGCSATMQDGRLIFQISASVKKKFQGQVQHIASLVRARLTTHSIYRGQAIEVAFRDSNGQLDRAAQPKFMNLTQTNPVVFSRHIEDDIATSIYAPIRYTQLAREMGILLKRGVLLAGKFGTGKTLLARNVAREAVANGWTFIYVRNTDEMIDAIGFASDYGPTVIFIEDVDRITTGERTLDMDKISTAMDGIGNKNAEIITIMSTNAPHAINPMILRPGRTDFVVFLDEPDEEAVQRLVKMYGNGLIAEDADLIPVGQTLAGQIPAVINEVVKRSLLRALAQSGGRSGVKITGDDLAQTALSYLRAQARLAPSAVEAEDFMVKFGQGFGGIIAKTISEEVAKYIGQAHFEPAKNGHKAGVNVAALSAQ